MNKNTTNSWNSLFSAGLALLLVTLFGSQLSAQTLLSNQGFGTWLPNNWSNPTGSWYQSGNGATSADGSAVCDMYDYYSGTDQLTSPAVNANGYTSVTVDFDFCWEYNDYNAQYGDDEFDVVANNDVILQLFTSSAYTYLTSNGGYATDPPIGGGNWVHYTLQVPAGDITSNLTITWQGVPNWGASNPAIDNVTIGGVSNQTRRMSLSTNSISMGQLRVGQRTAMPLTVTSNGSGAIAINSSTMQIGTQFSNTPTNSRSINSGSSEVDSVIFIPTLRGTFNDVLTYLTNSDLGSELSITANVSGQGIQAVFSSNPSLNFGNTAVGSIPQKSFVFTNTGDDTLLLQAPTISGTGFSIISGPASLAVPPNQTGTVVVQFAPTVQQAYNGTLKFTASNGVTAPSITLSGTGTLPQIQISNSATLGKLRVGQSLQATVSFTNVGNDVLNITNVYLTQPSNRFSLGAYNASLVPNAVGVFHFTYSPNQRGLDTVIIHFTTNDPFHANDSVVVTGQGIQAVLTSAIGTNVTFGNVYVGRTVQQRFTISNTGDDTLFVQAQTIAGSGFSFVSGPPAIILLPNQSDFLNIQFTPTVQQPYNGTLTFTTLNGVPTPVLILSGNGTLPLIKNSNVANMGLVRVGQTAQGTVTFLNAGNDILHISNATLSQILPRFTIIAYDRSVSPGATGTVQIAYSPTQERLDSARLNFTTDDPTNVSVTIFVTGNGISPHMIVANVRETIDLGQVKVNSSTTHDFMISNNGSASLTLISATATPPPFTVTGKTNVIYTGTTGTVTVTFAPTSLGVFHGMLIVGGDDPANPLDTIFLTGTGINGALSINPANLAFGSTVPVMTTIMDTIKLTNTGTATLNINSYQLTPQTGAFAIVQFSAMQISAGGTAIVIVSFHPDTVGNYSAVLAITSDDAAMPTRIINLSGAGVKGKLVVMPSSIDFGTVSLDNDSIIRVWLKNIGRASLTINSLTVAGSEFNYGIFATPITINAGDSASIDLKFTPTLEGSVNGSVSFILADNTTGAMLTMHGVGASSAGVATGNTLDFTLSISPNPATTSVTAHISMAQSSDGEIKIFDLTGHEVVRVPFGLLDQGAHDISLPIERLVSGSYFVRITTLSGKTAEAKLVLQR